MNIAVGAQAELKCGETRSAFQLQQSHSLPSPVIQFLKHRPLKIDYTYVAIPPSLSVHTIFELIASTAPCSNPVTLISFPWSNSHHQQHGRNRTKDRITTSSTTAMGDRPQHRSTCSFESEPEHTGSTRIPFEERYQHKRW